MHTDSTRNNKIKRSIILPAAMVLFLIHSHSATAFTAIDQNQAGAKSANSAAKQAKTKQNKKTTRKHKPNPAMAKITDDPNLPRVLLIGDSISIGYTVPTRKLLQGKANLHRPLTNCGPTTRGVADIDKWLGDGKWDVIHFNWGLHDLKYMSPNGKNLADPKDPTSKPQVPIDKYEKNLDTL